MYFYYPRLKIEFSSKFQSPSQLDRISYLGVVVDIHATEGSPWAEKSFNKIVKTKCVKKQASAECAKEKAAATKFKKDQCTNLKDRYRIIDFQPKDADILGYTRGKLTQKAQLTAKTSFSNRTIDKITAAATKGVTPNTSSSGLEKTEESATSPELSALLSDNFVNALAESIEARTAGLLDEGRVFFADFRSIKEKRIGGTYDFDLMLEVPAFTYKGISFPCADLAADAYLVGVVRHVYDRGFTGRWQKVPEPQNDKSFQQVLVKHISDVDLWKFDGVIVGKSNIITPPTFTVSITTNEDAGRYVVRRRSNGEILGSGSGKSAKISIKLDTVKFDARVEFLNINRIDEGQRHSFSASPSSYFQIVPNKNEGKIIVGNYK